MSEERRARMERRRQDCGPPNGWQDRRKNVERRLTAAEELEMSPEEFALYFGNSAKASPDNDQRLDQAADVFERVRVRS